MCRANVGKASLATIAVALTVTVLSGCAIGFRGPAPDVSDKTAFVSGDVLSNRTEQGSSWFKYGTTTAYGQETEHGVVDFQAGVRQGQFGSLSGLAHHTTYHYALCAEDQDPSVDALCSGDQTFTTRGDDIRGPLLVLFNNQIITVQFDGVESGYNGEDPRGSVTQTGVFGPSPVVCMRLAGQKLTVGIEQFGGAVYALVFADLSPGANTAASELVTTLPTTCPADPSPATPTYPAGPGPGFSINDEG
jgi:hypothetical protein